MKTTNVRSLKAVTPKEEVSGARPLPKAPRTRVSRGERVLGVVDQEDERERRKASFAGNDEAEMMQMEAEGEPDTWQ